MFGKIPVDISVTLLCVGTTNRMKERIDMEFNIEELREVKEAIEHALKVIGDNYGIDIELGNITYTNFSFRATLEALDKKDGKRLEFERHCLKFKIPASVYGKTFEFKDSTYQIIGINPIAKKFPLIAIDLSTGKEEVFPANTVNIFILKD